ncbi:MAG TPA: anthranilate synthase component I family protein [Candidatus Limnocylindrales bacterium]|nr:anthranilate synthase component I family protein [Candidatus Limnocylindrales bacterium]
MIRTTSRRLAPGAAARAGASRLAGVRLEPLLEVAGLRPIDLAEAFRDLPGLALLESARPGRNARWSYLTADPIAVLTQPAPGGDPFSVARQLLGRLDPGPATVPGAAGGYDSHGTGGAGSGAGDSDLPPFLGGLVGYLGYDLGHELERLPTLSRDDQGMPVLHLALHDWVVAWDRRTGRAWLGGRAMGGDPRGHERRLAEVRRRVGEPRRASAHAPEADLTFTSGLDRRAYQAGVEAVRAEIARGQIYQANLTRRLETPFDGDPWPLYRRLRTGDPSLFSAYLEIGRALSTDEDGPGRGPRAILSASPEPFLAVDRSGLVTTDPIKGTRPRGRTREEDRALACELLASGKDRAENVMIVDVLRNDLGRVCLPGTVRVPRLCRLERTAAVQHLVSTVTGRLAPGRDAFHLLAASFPGGSITGAPKIRAMEILERLEPVRRGPYTGALGWIGPDGAMATSIIIRTFVADGRRLSIHVGGGITYRSDPAAEWDETVAKARGPLGAIGGREVGRA